ncbi:retrovirus-related pol polyprotein from transposon TNT 1-94 [Tanacetum coccineum]
MANLSSYDPDVLSEVLLHDTHIENDMSYQETETPVLQSTSSPTQQDALIMSVIEEMSSQVAKCNKVQQENMVVNETLTSELERYKEQIHSLKLQLNATVESHKTLSTTVDVLKKESKQKEDKYLDEIIDLQKKKKALDNVVFKMARRKAPTLYDGHSIVKTHVALFVPDTEETLELAEESRLKMLAKQNDPSLKKHKVNLKPVDYVALNKLSEHFAKYFMPKKQLSAEQAYWLPISQPVVVNPPVPSESVLKKEIPRVLPTISIKKELSLDNDRLLEHILCQDVMNVVMHANNHHDNVLPANHNSLVHDNSALDRLKHENDRLIELLISQDLVHTAVNSLPAINDYKSMEQSFVDEYEENLKLQTELAKNNDMIDKAIYNELSNRCSQLENQCISLEIKLQRNKESFQNQIPPLNQNALEFKEFFTINELHAQLKAKNVSIAKLKEHITNLKGKNVVESVQNVHNSNVVTLKAYKLDLPPLSPCIKNNMAAHVDYLKHTQANADILREIVEDARELRPLDSNLASAYKFVTRIPDLLVYVSATCPSTKHVSDKLVVVTPMNRTMKVRFAEPLSCSIEASGSKPNNNTKNDRIPQTSRSNKKKNKVEDHPRIVKSSLHNLNRISKSVCNLNVQQSVLNANSQLMCATCNECMFDSIHDSCVRDYHVDVNARVKSVKSKNAKRKKKKMWKTTGTVRFGNDQIAKIMGYSDYQLGNVTISRVYYVEGLGHILFPVGQFYDSDLEVTFRKHMCYIRNLDGADLLSGSRDTNLYTISLDDMLKSSLICLLSKASKTKSCITHETSVAHTPQQNGIVERRNRTLVEAVRTMLIFSKAPLFLWAEAVFTACYTQNCSLIRLRYNKTPYELLHDKKPNFSYLHVFGSLCYLTNDSEDLGKLKAKADIGIFVGYAPAKKAFRIYKKRTRLIQETIHVTFDELTAMASEQFSSGPAPQVLTPVTLILPAVAQRPADLTGSSVSTSLEQDAPYASTSSTTQQDQSLTISQGVAEQIENTHFDDPCYETLHENSVSQGADVQKEPALFEYTPVQNILNRDSSSQESSSNVQLSHTPFELLG